MVLLNNCYTILGRVCLRVVKRANGVGYYVNVASIVRIILAHDSYSTFSATKCLLNKITNWRKSDFTLHTFFHFKL